MRKKLVFFLYIGDNRSPQERIESNGTAAIHFLCLKRYRDRFDTAKFILSVKDGVTEETISAYIMYIMSIGYCVGTEFAVEKNTELRESKVFKYEMTENKDNDGKLIFFSHLRGEANDNDSMRKWVFSNYYFALEEIWQPVYWLCECSKGFFGFPMSDCRNVTPNGNEIVPKYGYYYLGTIFWANTALIREAVRQDSNGEYPKIFGRFYSENFPATVIKWEKAATYNNVAAATGYWLYEQFDPMFLEWCDRSEFNPDVFYKEFEKINGSD